MKIKNLSRLVYAGALVTGISAVGVSTAVAEEPAAARPAPTAPVTPAPATTVPDVVAEINGEKISKTALDSEIQKQVGPQFTAIPDAQKRSIYARVLEIMIERQLLTAAATKNGVKITDKEVNKLIADIKGKFPSPEEFDKLLKSKGLDQKTFQEGVRQDLVIKSYIDTSVFKDLAVSEEEAKKAFEADPKKFIRPEEVHARHILFRFDSTTDPAEKEAEVKKKAEEVLAQAKKSGADFSALAKANSEDSTKERGGDLGFFTANQMVPPFSQAAFSLKPGEVSDLVKTRFGYHIIKVEERRGGGAPTFDQAKADVEGVLLQQKQADALKTQLAELQKENKVIVYLK